jgi:hypothetical protein
MIKELFSLFQGIEDMTETVKDTVRDMERRIERSIKRLQKKLMIGLLEVTFIILGALLLIGGIIAFLARYIRLDLILIVTGLLLLYGAFLLRLSQK